MLYRCVQQHLETWLARCREGHDDGPVPEYVEREFRRYLDCGILARGFARAYCDTCGHDFLIAFSRQGRGVCPSCNARRMVATAAHLTDHVLPDLPVRQWVLAVPKRLRLTDLDRELERRGHRFVRCADDSNIYVKSEHAGQHVEASITRFLATRLKLKVNEAKSTVAQPWQRKFLGFSFTRTPRLRRRIAPQALTRFKPRLRVLTDRNQGRALGEVIDRLALYLRGWRGYFGFCETPSVLRDLDSWIHHRLRSLVWQQRQHGRRRFAQLVRRGVNRALAAQTAGSAHGPWRLTASKALHLALPNAYFAALGLPRFHVSPTA